VKNKIDKANVVEIYDLNEIQKGMLFHYLKDPDSNVYNAQLALQLKGDVDPDLLRESINRVQLNNELLRSVFNYEQAGRPLQIVLRDCPINFQFIDYSSKSGDDLVQDINVFAKEDRITRFDLGKLPLRVSLIREAERSFILYITHHHILYDGWSTSILLAELFEQYRLLSSGKDPLVISKIPYRTVAEGVGRNKNKRETETEGYWKGYLSGYEITSAFPEKRLTTAGADWTRKHTITLNAERIQGFANAHKVTKAAIAYAVYGIVFHRYTRNADVVFGTTVSNRDFRINGASQLIGNFVNTLPLRVRDIAGKSLLEIAREVNGDLVARHEFNSTSYGEIKRFIGLKPGENLFDSIVVIENYPLDEQAMSAAPGLKIKLHSSYENTGIPLVITVMFRQEAQVEIIYQADVVADEFAHAVGRLFTTVIDAMVTDPGQCAESLPVLSKDEQSSLLIEYNNSGHEYDTEATVVSMFAETAVRYPSRTALELGSWKMTYRELGEVSGKMTVYLRSLGIGKGNLVGLMLDREEYLMPAIFGIMKAGAVYVPIDPYQPAERIAGIASDSGMKLLLSRKRFLEIVGKISCATVDLDSSLPDILGFVTDDVAQAASADGPAYIIHTSRSTGKPKGVMIKHRSLVNYITWAIRNYVPDDNTAFALYTSLSFDLTLTSLFAPLLSGNKMVIYGQKVNELPIERVLADNKVEIVKATPSHLKVLVDTAIWADGFKSRIRRFIVGGERLEAKLARQVYERFDGQVEIFNEYGPTEATVGCMTYKFDPNEPGKNVPIGVPAQNTSIYILDKYLNPVPRGIDGELCIAGDCLAMGYLHNDELTNRKFISSPAIPGKRLYRTGDTARWLEGTNIEYLGRIDNQIKLRGFCIEPGEIECQLNQFNSIIESSVVARGIEGNTKLVAYFNAKSRVDQEELRDFLAAKLPQYMIPQSFVQVDAMPLNSNGKLDIRALPEPSSGSNDSNQYALGEVQTRISAIWSDVLGVSKVPVNKNFFDLGSDSIKVISASSKLRREFKLEVRVTDIFTNPTVQQLAEFIGKKMHQETTGIAAVTNSHADRPGAYQCTSESDIAIIGMAGRFPGAANINEFYRNLRDGVESISRAGDPKQVNDLVKAKGYLDGYDLFDSAFFDYIPSEAMAMDPQMRVFHECTWEALEDSGYNPYQFDGAIGLYAGASVNPLFNINVDDEESWIEKWERMTLADKDFLCSRISYRLNLKGPSVNISTACSTSLVAVDSACNDLLAGKCDIAIAGGVSITFHDNEGYRYHKGMILSPDGKCRAFDKDSGGTVGGNGAGAVVLKKLKDALRDGDTIHAIIKGTAVNNDGNRKVGYAAPSVEGQSKVISTAIRNAGIEPDTITYVEAHGTGTSLGDPVEIAGLTKAFATTRRQFCAVGSVKTNIGHLDAAAGIAGLIKTVLSLKNRKLFPSLHYRSANPEIQFAETPFYVNTETKEWRLNDQTPLRAGVSSFGIGGTNAHVIVEEAPDINRRVASVNSQLLLLSAKTPGALKRNAERLLQYFKNTETIPLADIAYTLQSGREHFDYRSAVVCSTKEQAVEKLLEMIGSEKEPLKTPQPNAPIVFMFTGQGSQYHGMFEGLYTSEPFFKDVVDSCLRLIQLERGDDLVDGLIFNRNGKARKTNLDLTEFTQPVIFTVEYALCRLLMHWGITPSFVIGHSVGEYVAACISGVFTLEDAVTLIVKRGELMQSTGPGAMVSVLCTSKQLNPLLDLYPELSIAAINSPEQIVVSGSAAEVERFQRKLDEKGIAFRALRTSHAFHSCMMDDIMDKFESVVGGVKIMPQQIPLISNLTGKHASDAELSQTRYWVEHLRREIKFGAGLETILRNGPAILVEIGPGNTLSTFAKSSRSMTAQHKVIQLVRRAEQTANDLEFLTLGISEMWNSGAKLDWAAFQEREKRHKVSLPTYSFDPVRYPVNEPLRAIGKNTESLALKRNEDTSDWFFMPTWKFSPIIENRKQSEAGTTLIFIDELGLCKQLADNLSKYGQRCILVKKEKGFNEITPDLYSVNLECEGDINRLFERLRFHGLLPDRIIYSYGIKKATANIFTFSTFDQHSESIYGLLTVVKAAHQNNVLLGRKFVVLTNELFNVTGNEALQAGNIPPGPLMSIISQEYPGVSTSHIDISLSDEPRYAMIESIREEILSKNSSGTIALRNSRRWAREFQNVFLTSNPGVETGIVRRGLYLITGGLGKLGYCLSEYLMKEHDACVLLVGRTALSPIEEAEKTYFHDEDKATAEKIAALQRLKALGRGEVAYVTTDLSDPFTLSQAIAIAEAKYGPLRGVVHAAGLLDFRKSISDLTRKDFDCQFLPKVIGLHNLVECIGNRELDFCILTSSLSAILGGLRYGAYAVANGYMDYFVNASQTSSKYKNWISVNLDGLDLDDGTGPGIRNAELVSVFKKLLSLTRLPQVVVSVADLHQRIVEWVNRPATSVGEGTEKIELDTTDHNVSTGPGGIEGSILDMWCLFFGMPEIGIDDNFFVLGGDSLKVLTLINRIDQKLGLRISIADFFSNPTVRQLASFFPQKNNDEPEHSDTGESAEDPVSLEHHVLSPLQEQLFFIHELDPSSVAYNMPMVLELTGELDRSKFTNALKLLIDRHDSLRTSFAVIDGLPQQVIHRHVNFEISDCRESADVEEQVKAFLKPFDLAVAPLMRAGITKTDASGKCILLLDMHHIVTDAVSRGVLMSDFIDIYNDKALLPVKFQYKDYVEWLGAEDQRRKFDSQLAFWKNELSDTVAALDLPSDFQRPAVKTYGGEEFYFELTTAETSALKSIAGEHGATMFMVLLAIYNLLISRLTNQRDTLTLNRIFRQT